MDDLLEYSNETQNPFGSDSNTPAGSALIEVSAPQKVSRSIQTAGGVSIEIKLKINY